MEYKFKLRFPLSKLEQYASDYAYNQDEQKIVANADTIKSRGYLLKEELQVIANWKTHRSKSRVAKNDELHVQEITRFALSTKSERLRIEILTLLEGFSWPTSSTILHFYHHEKYPILDVRALYSLSSEHVLHHQYNFEFWYAYTSYCRMLADNANVTMRRLDRALWQYSNEHQIE
jgi:hypothetical protein